MVNLPSVSRWKPKSVTLLKIFPAPLQPLKFGRSRRRRAFACAVQEVDDAGNLYFLSGRSSEKNQHIIADSRVQLLFANVGDSDYMSLHGTATISDSRADREKYWTPIAKTWFHGGVDDPEVTVIKVEPAGGILLGHRTRQNGRNGQNRDRCD